MPTAPADRSFFHWTVDRDKKRIRTKVTGGIHLKEVEEYVERKIEEGIMSFSDLIDCREATTAITAHDIHHLVGILRRLAGGIQLGPVAILVSDGDSITFGMARMMAALIDGTLSIRPFREIEEAEAWLRWSNEG